MSKTKTNRPHDLNPNKVFAHFMAKGTTLKQWSKRKHLNYSTVKMALRGERDGELSRRIIKALKKEIGS